MTGGGPGQFRVPDHLKRTVKRAYVLLSDCRWEDRTRQDFLGKCAQTAHALLSMRPQAFEIAPCFIFCD